MLPKQVSDDVWLTLIAVSLRHYRKIGKFKNRRYERNCVYICRACLHLAMQLTDRGLIERWQGGYRRLSAIERDAIARFRQVHKAYHTDPDKYQ